MMGQSHIAIAKNNRGIKYRKSIKERKKYQRNGSFQLIFVNKLFSLSIEITRGHNSSPNRLSKQTLLHKRVHDRNDYTLGKCYFTLVYEIPDIFYQIPKVHGPITTAFFHSIQHSKPLVWKQGQAILIILNGDPASTCPFSHDFWLVQLFLIHFRLLRFRRCGC